MSRTKMRVDRVEVTPFFLENDKRPFKFLGAAKIKAFCTRIYTDGKMEKGVLIFDILPGYITDGASTFFPISKLVPQWIKGDDNYNAASVAHDILYANEGVVLSALEPLKLSREEVDDILRGIWRCWGMSRFVAGCADKGVEIFAGGKRHWGNDGYNVRKFTRVEWVEQK